MASNIIGLMSKSSMIFYVETGWQVHVTLLNLGTGSGTPSIPVKVNYTCPSTKLIKGYSLVRLKLRLMLSPNFCLFIYKTK